ncbi:hypothetical protein DYB32_007608 [Aphanomyces invadans]|uniref:Uncharacterized protein n=1 Tax=Aphanomyces invadans TaxID=157072 RepID=A0A3R6ZLB8_9STRA|nr:hypothetical protein DYB32_007608 [Aphanomyces invadans]
MITYLDTMVNSLHVNVAGLYAGVFLGSLILWRREQHVKGSSVGEVKDTAPFELFSTPLMYDEKEDSEEVAPLMAPDSAAMKRAIQQQPGLYAGVFVGSMILWRREQHVKGSSSVGEIKDEAPFELYATPLMRDNVDEAEPQRRDRRPTMAAKFSMAGGSSLFGAEDHLEASDRMGQAMEQLKVREQHESQQRQHQQLVQQQQLVAKLDAQENKHIRETIRPEHYEPNSLQNAQETTTASDDEDDFDDDLDQDPDFIRCAIFAISSW